MFSFKKYLDGPEVELYQVAVDCYRAAIDAIERHGARAHPQFADDVQRDLAPLSQRLAVGVSPEALVETQRQLEKHLEAWGARGNAYLQEKTTEVREILLALAQMTAKAAERDDGLAGRLTHFTTHLENLARLDDLAQLRTAVLSSAGDLKKYTEQVRTESRETIARLKAEIARYQSKLDEMEHLAGTDELTGLPNRRQVEQALEARVHAQRVFSVALFDLNGFKPVNDTFGHNAGDELLRQFAQELKTRFRRSDVVGRWGGDEFIAVIDGVLGEAQSYLDRVRNWVFGRYTLNVNGVTHKVVVDAAIGIAEYQFGESVTQLLARADAAMYANKAQMKGQSSRPPRPSGARLAD